MDPLNRGLLSVLVVDDHPQQRYGTARTLRAAGYKTMEAASGSEALEFAEYVAAVVLDIHLPDVMGFEVCRLLRKDPRTSSVPIVHITAMYLSEEDHWESRKSGADAYFTSPADPAQLVATIDELIRMR
ncbi:MAG: hybrid sensor histidine kinase/response regulator [Ramlibacter sp.]|jgi:DNA-binding response OmpR family regulator|uniref:response regulator n=1 Tax=Ramlibacter sp. TaxID=1917967 RepID=UPI00262ED8D2|nr:response regulator [Ramlibacter sp.]MDB5753142.1 hybrid sensor histidine kinase/response regulator [Ramlibacter sp.]